jgi:pimeloyl-ACP methyl ester carboxylesterase
MSFQSDLGKISYLYRDGHFPLIMLHGLGGTGNSFLKVAQQLPSDFALIMPDLLGHGKTVSNASNITIENQGILVKRIVEHLGASEFGLYGHSYGGWISLYFSINIGNPRILILEDSAGLNPTVGEEGDVEKFLDAIMRTSPWNNRETIRSIIMNNATAEKKITHDQLNSLTERTLIMWGEEDRVIPIYFGKLMHENIKSSNLITFPNAAHVPHVKYPEKVASAITSFYKGTI